MSRTNKDRPSRVRFPEYLDELYAKTKKRKEQDAEWHWLQATPSWWNNLFHTRPQRREAQQWEREVQKIQDFEELEELDKPNVSKKPHKYYW